ncbi:putative 2-dehydropantoate 2-reductase [Pleurocapsales cyanobacterium LEGE 10410]|nr:putative 2-dehydropantoate 2-reductase [Pleurocapsales cyanobacterium LEGE 10410]
MQLNFISNNHRSKRSYAIIGTGAIGGFYGACLQKAGFDVHFLLNRDYHHVSQHGLAIESPDGNFALPSVQAYNDVNQMPSCDVVIVALKTTKNYLLPQILPQVLKDDGVVLVLQNGWGAESEIAQIVGSDRLMGGICFTLNYKLGAGHIRHLDYGLITLADYAPDYVAAGISQRMRQIAADFTKANVMIQLHEDLFLARWQKLICNIPVNGLSVVLNSTNKQLFSNVHVRTSIEQLMAEIVSAAAAYGRHIPEPFIQKRIKQSAAMEDYETSMKIDFNQGRSLEVEAIFGNPLRTAWQAGVQMPQVSMLYRQLKFFDAHTRFSQSVPLSHKSS